MNVLFLGDLVSPAAIDVASLMLRKLRRELKLDLVIAEGENIHTRNGITESQYEALRMAGVDVVTLGNHAWDQTKIYDFIDDHPTLIRPFNYPPETPGRGVCITEAAHRQVAVIVAMGNVHISHLPSPFLGIDALIQDLHAEGVRHIIVDIHAEASAEKMAMGYYLDGHVSAVLGTHTHVATADEQILPQGTGYQTDVGMTGAKHSVIGMAIDVAIQRFVTQRHVRYAQPKTEDYLFNATFLQLDDQGACTSIKRIQENLRLT